MKIAVTYDNGNIFQHFGKTEFFKVYEVEDSKVISSEVIGSNGTGHGALAGLLAEQNVDVLICGGIGGGAQAALTEAGIQLCSGAQGDADQAVEAYLKGELVSVGSWTAFTAMSRLPAGSQRLQRKPNTPKIRQICP